MQAKTMDDTIQMLLEKTGRKDGMRIPIANAENSALEEKIEELLLKKHKTKISLENANAKLDMLQKHSSFLNKQSEENQLLLTNHQKQVERDKKIYFSKLSERNNCQRDTKSLNKELEGLIKRNQLKQDKILANLQVCEKKQKETKWDCEALEAWKNAIKKRDDDTEVLKKFEHEDEKRLLELENQRLMAEKEVQRRQELLKKVIMEIKLNESVLKRIGLVKKELACEKNTLIAQWQDSVTNLRMRDEEIAAGNEELKKQKELLTNAKINLEESEKFLQHEQRSNNFLMIQVTDLNMKNSMLRKKLNGFISNAFKLQIEMDSEKRGMLKTVKELEKERAIYKSLTANTITTQLKIDSLQSEIEKLKIKLAEVAEISCTVADRTTHLENLIDYEKKRTAALEFELAKTQQTLYKTRVEMVETKDRTKRLEMSITSSQLAIRFLKKQAKIALINYEKQKEMVYDLEFRKSTLETKLSEIEGSVTDDLLDELVAKAKDLQETLQVHTETNKLLQGQINRLADDRRRLTGAIDTDTRIVKDLRDKLQNFLILYEMGLKQVATAKIVSQKKQVEENVLRLRVDNLTKGLSKQDKSIFNLQKFRLELELAMKERQLEIKVNKDILTCRKKNLEEELGRLKLDAVNRKVKVDHLQKRYEVLMSLLGRDETGEPMTLVHFKLLVAQQKHELQKAGDDMDKKVNRAEKEIMALENTLKVITLNNNCFKASMHPVDKADEAMKEMERVMQEQMEVETIMRKRKKQLRAEKTRLEESLIARDEMEEDRDKVYEKVLSIEQEIGNYRKDQELKIQKIEKADKQIKRILKTMPINDEMTKYVKDLAIKTYQDVNWSAIQQLRELVAKYEEIGYTASAYLNDYGIGAMGSITVSKRTSSRELITYQSPSSSSVSTKSPAPTSRIDLVLSSEFGTELKEQPQEKQKTKPKLSPLKQDRLNRFAKSKTNRGMYKQTKEDKLKSFDKYAKLEEEREEAESAAAHGALSVQKIYSEDSFFVDSGLFYKKSEPVQADAETSSSSND